MIALCAAVSISVLVAPLAHGTLDVCGVVRALTLEVRIGVISPDSGEAHLAI